VREVWLVDYTAVANLILCGRRIRTAESDKNR
jgi:hypothetical protein